jgi:hypothetical protein
MDVAALTQVATAAKEIGRAKTTLFHAIARGEIVAYRTSDGLPLVLTADVRDWARKDRPKGRPKKGETRALRPAKKDSGANMPTALYRLNEGMAG